jgi:hypothetical protein
MDRGIEGGRDFSYLPFGQGLADAAWQSNFFYFLKMNLAKIESTISKIKNMTLIKIHQF